MYCYSSNILNVVLLLVIEVFFLLMYCFFYLVKVYFLVKLMFFTNSNNKSYSTQLFSIHLKCVIHSLLMISSSFPNAFTTLMNDLF